MIAPPMSSNPPLLVYAEPLLGRSMTFIREQAEALISFSPYYVSPHYVQDGLALPEQREPIDRKSTRLNSSHQIISYAVFCLKKKKTRKHLPHHTSNSTPIASTAS